VAAGNIIKGMQVLDHRGTLHGTVDAAEGDRLHIMKRGMDGLEGHWIPIAAVERVDHAVHLFQHASDAGIGTAGATGAAAGLGPRQAEFAKRRWYRIPLPWFVALVALALVGVVATHAMRRGSAGRSVASGVTLPGGRSIAVAPGSVEDDLQQFLAAAEPGPRNFTLATLDFAPGDATVPAGATQELKTLAGILAAYPRARVELVGYADVPNNATVAADVQAAAALGRRRAAALAAALIAAGVPAGAITAASGNDPDYLDSVTPATAKDADDRHPDLIVTRK
jgi:outer membrane protein OmpA-like peptidoglycan-associated protein